MGTTSRGVRVNWLQSHELHSCNGQSDFNIPAFRHSGLFSFSHGSGLLLSEGHSGIPAFRSVS